MRHCTPGLTHMKEVISQCDGVNAGHLAIGHIIAGELLPTVGWSPKCGTFNVLCLDDCLYKGRLPLDAWAAQSAKRGAGCLVAIVYHG